MLGQTKTKGILLEDLTWIEAEKILTEKTVIVIPLGAAAKEHGPYLKLKNDLLIAEYLKKRVLEQSIVVIAPTINYHFYPAFLEYPGSTSLRLETARDLIVDVCKEGGTHADEIETSMMLYMAPATVDMKKAAKDYHPSSDSTSLSDTTGSGVTPQSTSATLGSSNESCTSAQSMPKKRKIN